MNLSENKVLLELASNFHANPDNFCFFIGAGLSQPLFPSWGKLLKTFVSRASTTALPYSEDELNNYIEKGEHFLEVADSCVQALGVTEYRDTMEAEFDKEFFDEDIPQAYQDLFALSPKVIFTTNYDRIPERLSKGRYRTYTNKSSSEAARAYSKGQSLIFKIHGDIGSNDSIVLTTTDYQKIIHSDPATKLFIESCFSTKTFIFIGFSLTDPHIDLILGGLQSKNGGIPISHYVLLNEQSKFKIDAFSKKYGLKIIPYSASTPTHPEVSQFIRTLQHSIEPEAVAPRLPDRLQLSDMDNLFSHVQHKLSEIFVGASTSVFFSENALYIGITVMGQTIGEIQRELLSALKIFSFSYEPMDSIFLNLYSDSKGSTEFREIQTTAFTAQISSTAAYDYATKKTSASVAWQEMKFFTVPEITNPLESKTEIRFPLSIGLLNE